jgi:hypothetical protein
MVRVTGRYELVEATMTAIEPAFDAILDALHMDNSIQDPDLIVDLAENVLQVEFILDTDDPYEAGHVAGTAMKLAFALAGIDGPDRTQLFAHNDLVPAALQFVPA